MANPNPQNKPAEKFGNPPIAGKDQRPQAEKDKQKAFQKPNEKKEAPGKLLKEPGNCS